MESRLEAEGPQTPSTGSGAALPAAPSSGADAIAPSAAPPTPDREALRGTRFEFGGRRPYAFPTASAAAKAANRPLPGIGTVALGKVSRVAQFGAFVDFLGFRGLIHISQLLPGQRVERVEDVLQLNDEAQIRVIGVDPERRHINLALITKITGGVAPPELPPTAEPPANAVQPVPHLQVQEQQTQEQPVPTILNASPEAPPPVPRKETARLPLPMRSVIPAAPPKPAAAPLPSLAQHGARAIRRELVDPRHPKARLLASGGDRATRPTMDKERYRPEQDMATAAPVPARVIEPPRPIHVFGPDPEPVSNEPATLEALAARFGQKRDQVGAKGNTAADRSRQEREKQALILARLRQDAAKFTK